MEERSTAAVAAGTIGMAAVALAVTGPLLIHLGLLTPLSGFYVFAVGFVIGMPLALILAVVGFVRLRQNPDWGGRDRAWRGLGAGLVLLGTVMIGAGPHADAPPIHDITTDIDDPPVFTDAVRNAPDRKNGVDYPDGGPDVPAQQRAAFPDLGPLRLAAAPDEVFDRAIAAAEELGWEVGWKDRASHRLEASDTTAVFRFVDDVAIRIRPDGAGSVVDLRSNSRVGGGDVGANYARIMAFASVLQR